MRWNLTVIIGVLVVVVSYGLYQLSYEVQQLNSDLRSIRSEIKENKQAVQILKAEWAYRNRPDYLKDLTAKYLPLLLVAPYQVASLQELPEREIDPSIKSLVGVPLPRRKPRLQIPSPVTLPSSGLQLATYRAGDGGSER
ncbi:cell division protein FtsL [Sneathiella glossodoripedis]|uniref:cell division protein FtsL n=1 Tax=Sneathiella glossodoripedis TaxID=418853 RepID=UPI00047071F1|nr:hypothetical protein [Sneathiella glossodoripedis]